MSQSVVPPKRVSEELSKGVRLEKMYPGGRRGPNDEVLAEVPCGQMWVDSFLFGGDDQPFKLSVPDIRLPANQFNPMHWHNCWIALIVIEGQCLVGDWWMSPGDVVVVEAGLEYGPLLAGPSGVQVFEVFAQAHLQSGGLGPEYHDHPTLKGGQYNFLERTGRNKRNEGHSTLPCDGVEGLTKGRLELGWQADLGDPDDPDRGLLRCAVLAPGGTTRSPMRSDWHGYIVLEGTVRLRERELEVGSVLIAEPGAEIGVLVGGAGGAKLLEVARTAQGMPAQSTPG